MLKLNLGCGQNKKSGYVNVDKFDVFKPEVVWNLEKCPWPFDDNSADEIVMYHSLEHMGAAADVFLSIIKELYRVSTDGAKILINVPHPRCDDFINDPTHVRPITAATMALFSKKNNRLWAQQSLACTPLADYLNVDFDIVKTEHLLTPSWQQAKDKGEVAADRLEFAANHYFNVIAEIALELKVCK